MAEIYFESWVAWERTTTGYLTMKVRDSHLDPLRKALRKLKPFEEKNGPRMIETRIKIHYRKRTIDQNALMWSLLDIIATEHNAGAEGEILQDKDYFYRLYLHRYAPRETAHTGEELIKTSSQFNTLEMSAFIDRIFDELAQMDIEVTNPVEIGAYWEQHKMLMQERSVVLRESEVFSAQEYKAAVKLCEACGASVWHEDIGSSLAHIKAVGMGGHREHKYLGAQVMHLCDPCHVDYDNGKGRAAFIEKHPHLRNKIESEIGKEIVVDGEAENHMAAGDSDGEELDLF